MSEKKASNSLLSVNYLFMLLMNILTNLGFSIFSTTITAYSVSLGASLQVAGIVASAFSVAALIIRPFAGAIFDRSDKKKVFFFSSFLFGAIIFAYAFVKQIGFLIVLRVLHGILFGVNTTVMMALTGTFLPKDRVGEGMGYFSASMLLGQAIGPTLGVAIQEKLGYMGMYSIIALAICIPAILIWFLPIVNDNSKKDQPITVTGSRKFDIRNLIEWRFTLYALVCAGFSLYGAMTNSFVLLIGEERNIANISVFFTVSSLALMAVRIAVGKVTDKMPLKILVDIATIFTVISAVFVAKGSSLVIFLSAAVARAIGQGVGHVSIQSQALKLADADRMGVVSSTLMIGQDIGNIFAPIIGGFIADKFNYEWAFYAGLIIVAVLGIVFHINQSMHKEVEHS